MFSCISCYETFEPLKEENLCPNCDERAKQRFWELFGDEDPYSPQLTVRSSRMARVIIKKLPRMEEEQSVQEPQPA